MRNNSVFLQLNPLAAAVVLAFALPAWAAPREKGDNHSGPALEEIVVTASALRGTTDELSEAVSVLAGEALDEAKGTTLGETISGLPGVQSSNFGPGVGRPIIRGLEGARVAVLSGGLSSQDVSTVSQDHAPAVEAFLADQIEVLRGPATLLYGSGAIGGVVNVVDGRIAETAPASAFSGRAEARFDSVNDGHTGMFRIDGGSDTFALHADALTRRNDDYQLPERGEQANSFVETDTGALGGSLLGEWGFAGISVSRYEDRYGNPGEPGDAQLGESGVFLDIEQNRAEFKAGINQPFAGFARARFSAAHTEYQHAEFEGSEIGTEFVKEADELRVELTHEPVAGWEGALGLQALDSDFVAIGAEAFVPATASRALGLFILEQKRVGDLQLEFGMRVDDVSSDPINAPKRSFSPLSVSFGAIWRANEAWDVLLNLDHAERAPAEEELFANGPHIATAAFEIGDRSLSVETSNQLELGAHFHSERLEAKAAVYYNRFDDFIFLRDTGAEVGEPDDLLPVRQWSQADARFVGIEGEATLKLPAHRSGDWQIRLFGDSVRAKLDAGGNVARIPPARLGSELRWESGKWRASVSAVRHAEQDRVASTESTTPGYTLLSAHTAYHWDSGDFGWELFADARNVTDQAARVHSSFLKDRVLLPGRGVSFGLRAFF